MDFLKIGGKDDKNANVLVVTDHFTRYAQAYVTGNQQASTVARVFIDKFVTNYGWPVKILTDQAKDFNDLLFSALCHKAKIRKMRTSPYYSQTNGQTQRFNHTLMTMLGTLPTENKLDWQDWVSTLTHAYNCTATKVTGLSPYFLMFGREPRIPVDEEFGITFPKTKQNTVKQYVENLHKCLQWAYETAKEHIAQAVQRHKIYYDRQVNCMDIIPGNIVLVKQKVFCTQHKIEDHWCIPVYKVLEQCGDTPLFKFQKLGETETENLQRNMLFPFINVMREENEDIAEEVISELPVKSLTEIRADNLKCANYFMDMFFDEDL